jgi:hypothetical protein
MIEMLAAGGLAAMGPFPGKPTLYWRTRCLRCGTAADYRPKYVLDKNAEAEHTCRVCYWIEWAARADQMAQRVSDVVPDDDIRALANENDDDLMTVVLPATKKVVSWVGPSCGHRFNQTVASMARKAVCARRVGCLPSPAIPEGRCGR